MMTIAVSPLTTVFLVAIRTGTVMLFTPIQAIRLLPIHARLLLALVLSMLIAAHLAPASQETLGQESLELRAVAEFCNGLVLSLSIYAAFAVFQIAGQLIDTHIGLNALAILNPTEHTHEMLSSRLLIMLAVLFFFALNGHYQLLQGLLTSFTIIPPGKLIIFNDFSLIIQQFSFMFTLAFMLASPIIICLLIIDIAGGILTRNMPQISIYFLTLPIKIMLGFLIFNLLLSHINPLIEQVFESCFHSWKALMS